ncbi:MAG: hypothetical protein ACI4SG_05990 [Oligosphaeraceae bacterium]
MAWRVLLSLLFGFSLISFSQNVLKDTEFVSLESVWAPRPTEKITAQDGVVRLEGGAAQGERVLLQQQGLALVPRLTYIFSVEYRSESGAPGYVYLERSSDWHGQGQKVQGTPEWQTASFSFVPRESAGQAAYYAVLSLQPDVTGSIEYRNPVLEVEEGGFVEYAMSGDNVLEDAAFLEKRWEVRDPSRTEITGDCSVKLTGQDGGRTLVVQYGLRLSPGSSYVFTVLVRGTEGAAADFYVERGEPSFLKLQHVNVSPVWREATMEFVAPANESGFYAVLSTPAGMQGEVEFRAPRLAVKKGTLQNGGFQVGLASWQAVNAVPYDHQGDYGISAKLEGIGQEASLRQDGLEVKKGKIYQLAYDVRGGSDRRYTDIQGATWSRIAVLDDQGQVIPDCAGWRDCFDRWQHKEVTFVAERDMEVSLVCQLKEEGEVYFDNIVFQETHSSLPLLEIVLDAPYAYHNGVVEGQCAPGEMLTGRLFPALRGARLRLGFQGEEQVLEPQDEVAFQLPMPEAQGIYPIEAVLEDEAGEKLAEAKVDFQVRPVPPRSFAFDKNHVFHIDGKPIFPIHSWGNRGDLSQVEAFQRQRELGFNIILCNHRLLDVAADAGLLAMVYIPTSFASLADEDAARKNGEQLRQEYQAVMAHPSTALWFVTDEPAWRGEDVRRSQRAYNRLLAYLDDSRPAFLNEAPRGRVVDNRAYSLACDVYGVDIYPIPAPNTHSGLEDKMMTSVGKYTDICRETVRDQKPIWMTIQGFSWGDWNNAQEKIYPTLEESRYMAYEAIAHGATGLSYWGLNLGGKQNDQFLQDLSTTIHEVTSLSALLIAPVNTEAATADRPEVLVCQKSNEAGDLWIVLNESGEEIETTITGPFPKRLRVIQEERVIMPENDAFVATLPPYGLLVLVDADKPLPPPLEIPATSRQTERVEIPQYYEGASWIWQPGDSQVVDSQVIVRIPVTVDAPLEHAWLSVAVDDGFSCTINGKEVMRQKEWTCAWTMDVAKELKPGENEILIHGADLGGAPCGMLFSLVLSDGRTILSDGTQECRRPGEERWVPVEVIGPYGCLPWGTGVFPVLYTQPTVEAMPIP